MHQFLMILQLITQLFPLVIQTVKVVEDAFPQGGQGAVKLEMVRGILQGSFNALQNAEATFENVWPALNAAITGIVKLSKPAQQ